MHMASHRKWRFWTFTEPAWLDIKWLFDISKFHKMLMGRVFHHHWCKFLRFCYLPWHVNVFNLTIFDMHDTRMTRHTRLRWYLQDPQMAHVEGVSPNQLSNFEILLPAMGWMCDGSTCNTLQVPERWPPQKAHMWGSSLHVVIMCNKHWCDK